MSASVKSLAQSVTYWTSFVMKSNGLYGDAIVWNHREN